MIPKARLLEHAQRLILGPLTGRRTGRKASSLRGGAEGTHSGAFRKVPEGSCKLWLCPSASPPQGLRWCLRGNGLKKWQERCFFFFCCVLAAEMWVLFLSDRLWGITSGCRDPRGSEGKHLSGFPVSEHSTSQCGAAWVWLLVFCNHVGNPLWC